MYIAGWEQSIQEDNLGISRTKIFLSVHIALVALIYGSFSIIGKYSRLTIIFDLKLYEWEFVEPFAWYFIGLIGAVIAGASIVTLIRWLSVNRAGELYVKLRRLQLKAIEEEVGIIGLATSEIEYRRFSEESGNFKRNNKYYLRKSFIGKKDNGLDPLPQSRGWSALKAVGVLIMTVWIIMYIMCIGLLIII